MEKIEYFENLMEEFRTTDRGLSRSEAYMCETYLRSFFRGYDVIVFDESICNTIWDDVFKVIIKSGITEFIFASDSHDSIETLVAMLDFGFRVVGSISATYGISNYPNVNRGVVMSVNNQKS